MAEKFDLSVILRFIDKSAQGLKGFSANMSKIGSKMRGIGQTMSLALTAPIAGLGFFAIKSAIDIETAMIGIRKTVDATEEEFKILGKGLRALGLEVPVNIPELMGIAQIGGQLGIAKEDLLSFTKTMAAMAVSTNLTSEEAATAFARIAKLTKLPSEQFENLGSVIVGLGNTMAANEKDITDMTLRLASAGTLVGLTVPQIVALSASLVEVGLKSEAGGTAFSQVMKKIQKEVGTGSEKMEKFAKISGNSVKDFEKKWKQNAGSAMIEFIKGLAEAEKQGVNLVIGMEELGFTGIRISDALLRAKNASSSFEKSQGSANKLFKDGTALQNEAQKVYASTASQLVMFKNNISLLGESFGKIMLPTLRKVLKEITPFIDKLKELSPEMKENILKIAGIVLVGGPLLIGLGIAAALVGVLASPIVLSIVGIAAITAGVATVISEWDKVKKFFVDLWEEGFLKPFRDAQKEWADFNKAVINSPLGKLLSKIFEDIAVKPLKKLTPEIIKKETDKGLNIGLRAQFGHPRVINRTGETEIERLIRTSGQRVEPTLSESKVVIEVQANPETAAIIKDVTQIGPTKLRVENKSSVGNTLTNIFGSIFE